MKKAQVFALLLLLAMSATAQQNGPTMGWSSWNTFGINISDALIRQQADAMVSTGLKAVGYDHINIDDGYFGGRNTQTGELLIHPTRFPDGLKPVAGYIHSKGLKAGIYSDAGRNTCGNMNSGDTNGVNVGMYGYDQRDADFFFKECDFDFIKVDFCGGNPKDNTQGLELDPRERYTAIAEAIKATGKDHVRMNVCRWDYPGTWVSDVAFSWRTTADIYDGWKSVKGILAENLYLSAYCEKGRFNDMDMLEVGRSMSEEEDKTHFGMWCIMNSPLLIGCDLRNIKASTLNLLKNTELIALNQDTLYQQAYLVALNNGCHVLVKDIEQRNGKKRAFAIYNPTDGLISKSVTVRFEDLGLGGHVKLRDVFAQTDLGYFEGEYTVSLPRHCTRIFVAECETRLERVRYEAETAYISTYQELINNEAAMTGIYESASNCSAGFKATWLGMSEQNDLIFREVYSPYGGEYDLTIGYISGQSRGITIGVNGTTAATRTVNGGTWNAVREETVRVQLKKGNNQIRLSNATGYMPDIDYIDVRPVTPAKLVLSDTDSDASYPNEERITDRAGQTLNVQIDDRTLFKTGHWNTLCLPFSLSSLTNTPLSGASVKRLVSSSYEAGTQTLTLNFRNATSIEAGKPYIVRWPTGTNIVAPLFEGVTVGSSPAGSAQTTYADFVGCYSPVSLAAKDRTVLYMGGDSKVYYPGSNMSVNAFRAYFQLKSDLTASDLPSNGAKTIVLDIDGETTEIDALPNDKGQRTNDSYYSIDGVRLNGEPTQKGVYLQNGKKIVVK